MDVKAPKGGRRNVVNGPRRPSEAAAMEAWQQGEGDVHEEDNISAEGEEGEEEDENQGAREMDERQC